MHLPCSVCGKVFKKKCKLKEHMLYHDNIRPFKCSYVGCNKEYFKNYHLKRHIILAHSTDNPEINLNIQNIEYCLKFNFISFQKL